MLSNARMSHHVGDLTSHPYSVSLGEPRRIPRTRSDSAKRVPPARRDPSRVYSFVSAEKFCQLLHGLSNLRRHLFIPWSTRLRMYRIDQIASRSSCPCEGPLCRSTCHSTVWDEQRSRIFSCSEAETARGDSRSRTVDSSFLCRRSDYQMERATTCAAATRPNPSIRGGPCPHRGHTARLCPQALRPEPYVFWVPPPNLPGSSSGSDNRRGENRRISRGGKQCLPHAETIPHHQMVFERPARDSSFPVGVREAERLPPDDSS